MPTIADVLAQSCGPDMIEILLTRPYEQAVVFSKLLQDGGIAADNITISPIMRVDGTGVVMALPPDAAVIFTSSNAVRFAGEPTPGRRAYCVGSATTDFANDRGYDAICCGQSAQQLIDHILQMKTPSPLVHLRGEHSIGSIADRLECDQVVIYRQIPCALSSVAENHLLRGTATVLPLFSPRSAALLPRETIDWSRHVAVAISDNVAAICREIGFNKVLVAQRPDVKSMTDIIFELHAESRG